MRVIMIVMLVVVSSAAVSDEPEVSEKKPKERPPFRWVNPLPDGHDTALKNATFRSPSLGVDVGYLILLPEEYATSCKRYPVVYYLHGGRPGSESKSHRLAPFIDDAMKKGDIPPTMYVFVNGGPVSHYNMPDQPDAQGADVFIKELIPHIDATYRTIASRSGRALEGFSQGGRGTMRLSLRYPELFCSAAPGGGGYATEKKISESGGYESETLKFAEGDNVWDLARAYAAGDQPKVQWMIYVGTEGFNYENNLEYMNFLDTLGIKYAKLIVPDVPHSAVGIYESQGAEIMRFHADNFTR
jgi:enterochelin esterase-like enzyme